MADFWTFTGRMLHSRWTLFWALVFACISALGLGAGLLALAPMIKLILDPQEGQSLAALAIDYNSKHPGTIPQFLVDQLPTNPFHGVVLLLALIMIISAFGAVTSYMHQTLSITVSARTIARARVEAFARVVHMPLGLVLIRGPSQLVSRIIRDTAEVQRGLIAVTSKAIAQGTRGIVAFAVAIWYQPALTLIAITVLPVMFVILRKLGKRIRRGMRGALQGQEHLLRVSNESLQGLRAVKANTAELQAVERFDELNEEVVHQELKARTARALSSPIIETIATIVICGLAMLAAKQIIDGRMDLENFVLALGSLAFAGASLRPVIGVVNEIQASSAPAKRILEVLDEPREDDQDADRRDLLRHRLSIELQHVTLTYPGALRPALFDVSIRILHGTKVAIVGPNGSGKTTLLSLLPRLLEPDQGRVLIDEQDIASVTLRSLRQQIGVVTQETVLFKGSVAQNIMLGAPGATRQQMIDAAVRAHANEFIERLPGGYEADVLEQGASLSGGQRQRLAIARAILRDPSILILDEATSQIDAESEAHINAALSDFCKGRTAFLIAHRLSTVLQADLILLMDDGAIVDHGTHDELLERSELYRALTKTQLVGAGAA